MTFEIFWLWPIVAIMLVLTLASIAVMQWLLLRDNRRDRNRLKRQLTQVRKELTRLAVTDPHLSLGGLRAEHDPPTDRGQAPPRLGFVMGEDSGSAARWPKPWASMPSPVPRAVLEYTAAQTRRSLSGADTQVLAPVPVDPPDPAPEPEQEDRGDTDTPPAGAAGRLQRPESTWESSTGGHRGTAR